jgi:uncharacterized membrane protein
LVDVGFYGGLGLKALNALVENIGGFLILMITPEWLNGVIMHYALPELRQDPNDPLMNRLITMGQNFTDSTQNSIAIYMIMHGTLKLLVIYLLWKKYLWAFPLGFVVFGVFIAYELYSYMHSQSLLMLFIVIFDIIIVALIALEYRRLEVTKAKCV